MRLDFLNRGDADGPDHLRMAAEMVAEFLAVLDEQRLGVAQVPMLETIGQDGRCGVDGTGPAAASDFVDAGDDRDSLGPQLALEGPADRVAAQARGHEPVLSGWRARRNIFEVG